MSATRQAFVLGLIPIVIGIIYWAVPYITGDPIVDAAGATMLIALGLAMGFGFLVILRGARDL